MRFDGESSSARDRLDGIGMGDRGGGPGVRDGVDVASARDDVDGSGAEDTGIEDAVLERLVTLSSVIVGTGGTDLP